MMTMMMTSKEIVVREEDKFSCFSLATSTFCISVYRINVLTQSYPVMYSLDILGTSGPQLPADMGQFLQGGNFGYFATSRHLEKKVERLFD